MASPGNPVNESASRKIRVIVADDASGMRTYLRSILTGAGYDVTEAVDGGEAFDVIMRETFDLLITDLEMPGMDGYALLSAVSLLPKARAPVMVVCSALLDETSAMRRPELRLAAALLAKPVQPDDVLKAAEKALKTRGSCR